MSWALQHVKLTLEDAETGEVVVIEEGEAANEARVKEKAKEAKAKEAHEAKAKEAKEADEAKAREEAKKAKAREDAKETKAREAAKETKAREAARAQEAKDAKPKTTSSSATATKKPLAWRATKDNNYDGYAAKTRLGVFKALHARNTQWALFFERRDNYPAHLGCFRRLEQAKGRAQELHDAGWPESEFGEVTRQQVERACPVPGTEREEKPVMPPTPKTEDKPAAPASPPRPAAGEHADEVMMRSFRETVMAAGDDDDDDDD